MTKVSRNVYLEDRGSVLFHFFFKQFWQIRKKLAADICILRKDNLAGRSGVASFGTRLNVKYEFLLVYGPLYNIFHCELFSNLGFLG
jgi:hypothetical protein